MVLRGRCHKLHLWDGGCLWFDVFVVLLMIIFEYF